MWCISPSPTLSIATCLTARHATRTTTNCLATCTPPGLGHHVDHQLVALAAARLRLPANVRRIWYEELPYAEWDTPTAHPSTCTKQPHLAEIDESAMMRKLDAMGYYHTQIPVLYRHE